MCRLGSAYRPPRLGEHGSHHDTLHHSRGSETARLREPGFGGLLVVIQGPEGPADSRAESQGGQPDGPEAYCSGDAQRCGTVFQWVLSMVSACPKHWSGSRRCRGWVGWWARVIWAGDHSRRTSMLIPRWAMSMWLNAEVMIVHQRPSAKFFRERV